jgi:hypothetical protein
MNDETAMTMAQVEHPLFPWRKGRVSSFVIVVSFVIRISSFVIPWPHRT